MKIKILNFEYVILELKKLVLMGFFFKDGRQLSLLRSQILVNELVYIDF